MPNENNASVSNTPRPADGPITRRQLLGTAGLSTLALTGAAQSAFAQDAALSQPSVLNAPSETTEQTNATPQSPYAFIDGAGPGFRQLGEQDFAPVNSAADTWSWRDGVLYCTGRPTSVLRTAELYSNFEVSIEWNHRQHGGNSGMFIWADADVIQRMTDAGQPGLPNGIEVQMLDPGYAEVYLQRRPGGDTSWFTSHGDVFPVRQTMTPFPPLSPDGSRSFPSEDRVREHGNWNHYYVRAINGEVRLWVNGKEVSGGNNCSTTTGYICLESEGAPIEFRNIRIRELA